MLQLNATSSLLTTENNTYTKDINIHSILQKHMLVLSFLHNLNL